MRLLREGGEAVSAEAFQLVGTGLSVFEEDQPVEGPVVWLDSPAAVIEFVSSGTTAQSIVLARGGTTTFLTPALTSGVKGVITLQGHPESHLGILSREFGIPCVMGVTFTKGVRSIRGEVIPADGAIVRLDVTGAEGKVLVEAGAPTEASAAPDPEAEAAARAQTEQIQLLLTQYRGEVPHHSDGDRQIRSGLSTGVLELSDESVHRALRDDEVNDLLAYMGWNIWDFLAQRATEGESGLIPRQEYEALGCVQMWQRYPDWYQRITEAVGVEGLIEIGATPRREIASKVNLIHIWCTGFVPSFGRGILVDLELLEPGAKRAQQREVLQFMRRLYKGAWGEGPMFTSMRDYKAPLLGTDWLERFRDERTVLSDPEQRSLFQKFSASTELMGFLLHFDNRSGLADSGPYPTDDGGFMIVRDHFLHDPVYHWHDVAEELPHAITQAMFFKPEVTMELDLMDGATLFTRPANYLKYLTGTAVYVRDTHETPVSEIRRADEAEIERILARCDDASAKLYRRIASMPPRDKVMAGAQVYYTEFVAPFARAAGVWDELVGERDFFELDPLASEAYYKLVAGGTAAELMPRLFLMGTGYPPLPAGEPVANGNGHGNGELTAAVLEQHYPLLHALALRGMAVELPGDPESLQAAGLVASTPGGYLLTDDGLAAHQQLLIKERDAVDPERLSTAYDRFLAANGPMKAACARWHATAAGEADRDEIVADLADCVDRVEPALARTAELLSRFATYPPRLRAAVERAQAGEHDYVVSPRVDSIHTVWMELHEDYLQTLGRSREEEGSY
jgi:hypothetical protein